MRPEPRCAAEVRTVPHLFPGARAEGADSRRAQGQLVGRQRMNLTDPVADMLTRIRNACSAGHRRGGIPGSQLKSELPPLLRGNPYLADLKLPRQRAPGAPPP